MPDDREMSLRKDDEEREDEENEEEEGEGDDEETDEPEPHRPTPPHAPGAPVVHLAIEGTTRRRRGKGKRTNEPTRPQTPAEAEAAKRRADTVQAYVGLFRTSNGPSGGFKLAVTRLKPHTWDFGDGRGFTNIKGWCEDVFDPSEASEEYIKSRWGGGTYLLQVRGPGEDGKGLKHAEAATVEIAGDPLPGPLGTQARPASVPAFAGVPARVTPEEGRVIHNAMDQSKDAAVRADARADRERERADTLASENARLSATAAEAKATAASAMSRLESIERRLNEGGASSSKTESVALQLVIDMRKEDAKRHEEELRRREKAEENALQARQSPMMDWIKQQAEAHERERKAEMARQEAFLKQQQAMQDAALKQQQAFMEMQLKAADERATRYLDELKEARAEKKKEPDLVGQITKLAELRESLDLFGGDDGEESIGRTIIKMLPEIGERLPSIFAGIRYAATGQGGAPALPAAGAGGAPPGAIGGVPQRSPEEQAAMKAQNDMVMRLITLLEATLANGLPHEQIAGSIRDKFPAEAIQQVLGVDPDEVVAEIRKLVKPGSPLTTVQGAEHIQATLDACRELYNQG